MPNYFNLTKIGGIEPSKLVDIDEELCALLGVKPDSNYFVRGWVDAIGGRLALGYTWEQIEGIFVGDLEYTIGDDGYYTGVYCDLLAILRFLRGNYVSDAWAGR